MTTRVWKGGTANFFDAAGWTPKGRPVPGDSLNIVGGTATVTWQVLRGLSIQLGEAPGGVAVSNSAVLMLFNSVIAYNTTAALGGITLGAANSVLSSATIEVFGNDLNNGTISVAGFTGPGFPSPAQLTIDVDGVGATFINNGTLRASSAATQATLVVERQSKSDVLVNNGLIDAGSVVKLNLDVIGVGKIQFGAPYNVGPSAHALTGPTVETAGSVDYGQTVEFMIAPGVRSPIGSVDSHGLLYIGDPRDFHALIRDFTTDGIFNPSGLPDLHRDMISLNLPNLRSSDYQGDATGGVLTLTAGNEVAHLRFAGSYSLSSFQITTSSTETAVIVKPS